MTFESYNSETIRIGRLISNYLYGYEQVAMLIIPNICSLWTDFIQRPNSNLFVEDMGGGKSTLFDIIYQSNKKYITKLPSKIYAHELSKTFDKKNFQNKLLMHDDLIPAFSGLSKKSKEQLIGFFTELLSSGKYMQLGHGISGDCNALFGIARKFFYEHQIKPNLPMIDEQGNSKYSMQEQLFTDTFTDRVIQIRPLVKTNEEKLKIIDFMRKRNCELPKIKLPIGKKKKIILNYDDIDLETFDKICLDFDKSKIISIQRAHNYCSNFLKGNALLNGRNRVNNYDLEMLQDLFPLHFTRNTTYNKVFLALQNFTDLNDNEIIEKIGIARATYYKYKEMIGGKERFLKIRH